MTKAVFYRSLSHFASFTVSGHAGYRESGEDIVCAGISSAVMLTANGLTEVAKLPCDIKMEEDGEISLSVQKEDDLADLFIESLYIHLLTLQEEYPEFLKVVTVEV